MSLSGHIWKYLKALQYHCSSNQSSLPNSVGYITSQSWVFIEMDTNRNKLPPKGPPNCEEHNEKTSISWN